MDNLQVQKAFKKLKKQNWILTGQNSQKPQRNLVWNAKMHMTPSCNLSLLRESTSLKLTKQDRGHILNNQFSCVFSVDDKTSPNVQGPQRIVVEGEISLAVQVISNVPEESVIDSLCTLTACLL